MAAIGERMDEEEERLAERARELRRFFAFCNICNILDAVREAPLKFTRTLFGHCPPRSGLLHL